MFYNGPYLRVLTPRTTNGTNVLVDDANTIVFKEAHMPLSAKRHIEQINKSTPKHLQRVIQVVQGNQQAQAHQVQAQQPDFTGIAAEAAQLPQVPQQPVVTQAQQPQVTQTAPKQQPIAPKQAATPNKVNA